MKAPCSLTLKESHLMDGSINAIESKKGFVSENVFHQNKRYDN